MSDIGLDNVWSAQSDEEIMAHLDALAEAGKSLVDFIPVSQALWDRAFLLLADVAGPILAEPPKPEDSRICWRGIELRVDDTLGY